MSKLRKIRHRADFCVVGAGMAGYCAALAAARHGARVVLMHDRPVLGGNASSEGRIHICGADRHNSIPNLRETGILEEVRLENLLRNPQRSHSVWDTILFEKVKAEKRITLLLNCSCLEARMRGNRIKSATGWQLTTQTMHTVESRIFADCSGDAILAPLTGAKWRMGREARSEFKERLAPTRADKKTMGMSCLFQARKLEKPQDFVAPSWAYKFKKCDELPYSDPDHRWLHQGYWWIELGGEADSIHDTEKLRDELLRITVGVWDHIKNHCKWKKDARNWVLDWLQFLPAKRESRRFLGDHVLSQNDIESEGRFPDIVAYGGWTMDDHDPAGFWAVKSGRPATHFHYAPSPYGIPYRALYSKNIDNLMFAGRNASCTHMAMSSTRVMGTCSVMGQAIGTAAALAVKKNLSPRGVNAHIPELQQKLLADDCYLPWQELHLSKLCMRARLIASTGDPASLRDGVSRPVKSDPHSWSCRPGDHVAYLFDRPEQVREVALVVDTGLEKDIAMSYHCPGQISGMPRTMPRAFTVEGLAGNKWKRIARVEENRQRLIRLPANKKLAGARFRLTRTWGAGESRLFGFYVS